MTPVTAFLLTLLWLVGLPCTVRGQNTSDFDWTSIQPSNTLNWTPCYFSFQCTRLTVPFDYSAPQGHQAAIALIRYPSNVSSTDPTYAGPLFLNPGGPGASGIEFLLEQQQTILEVLGQLGFDVVFFDPRGVGFSTPSVTIFDSDVDSSVWDFSVDAIDVNSTSPSLQIPRMWARSQALGYLAEARDNGIFAYVTTDNAARDMWTMVQAYNQTKLQYYGFSYGTVLGSTFATLFPDKVGRMIIDADWAKDLLTADADLQDFFDSCHQAGPEACAFYESTSSQIAQRYNSLLASVRKVPVVVHSDSAFGIVDEATVRSLVLGVLYSPYPGYSALAPALAALEQGDGSEIFQLAGGPPVGQCTADNTTNDFDSFIAISCGDSFINDTSAVALLEYYQANIGISSFLDEGLRNRALCTGWRIQRENTFRGPVGGNTSFPILLIGNSADPVTPLSGAVNTSNAFPGSIVLTQNSPGHTSVAAPSSCTIGYIREYLVNGTLPSPGTVCQVDTSPFNTSSPVTARAPKAAKSIFRRKLQLGIQL